jgi:hypothetical protein
MMNNANLALRGIMSAPVTYPEHFANEVWTSQLPLVAQLLNWTEVDKIRDAYDIQASVLETVKATAKATAERNFDHAALIMAGWLWRFSESASSRDRSSGGYRFSER